MDVLDDDNDDHMDLAITTTSNNGLGPATVADGTAEHRLDGKRSVWHHVPADQVFVARYDDRSAQSGAARPSAEAVP